MAKEAKTNAMRMLDRQKVKYEAFSYECDEFIDGLHSADKIGAPYDQSFKTLVMEGKNGGFFVFVVPIEKEVDRKAAAKAVGEKTVDMIHVKDITKILFENKQELQYALPVDISLDEKSAVEGITIPFHKGAVAYYEECGMDAAELTTEKESN